MPFGLSNAHSTFMRLMTHILKHLLGTFVVVYFDDILVLSKFEADHISHLRHVLSILRDNNLYLNLTKCVFCQDSILFLGFVIRSSSIHLDDSKLQLIRDWPTPTTVTEVRSFHGLATFYRRFIFNFSSITAPLTDCLKLHQFTRGSAQNASFQTIKDNKALPDSQQVFELEMDASMVGIGAVLTQNNRALGYISEKLCASHQRWYTYEQELYAIFRAFHYWEPHLLQKEFILHSDHLALLRLNFQKTINQMHARWILYI
ncbi:hypothetical protein Scep_021651 [Stephania cephalantha]|uniref:Reverse transcriptase domain-containing protein n=1 Tax=Stephania cephalantha TaxID=152367 RepID=A0AAP0F9C7_9MAGN